MAAHRETWAARPRTRSHHFPAMRRRSPVARTTTKSRSAGSAAENRAPSRLRSTKRTRSPRRPAETATRTANAARGRRRGCVSDPFNEPTVPQGQVDQGPQGVVVVGASREVLGDHGLDAGPVEVDAHHLGAVQELDHVLPELVPEPLLEGQAVSLLAPGQDPGRQDAPEGLPVDGAGPEAGELEPRREAVGGCN